jgi:hypothetical protein
MRPSIFFFAASATAAAVAGPGRPKHPSRPGPDADGKYTLEAPGIKAQVLSPSHTIYASLDHEFSSDETKIHQLASLHVQFATRGTLSLEPFSRPRCQLIVTDLICIVHSLRSDLNQSFC